MDLIIVANIAAIGHELRESFNGWYEFEKFFLLFGAVYSSWRGLVFYWNLWSSTGDLYDKTFLYFEFTMLTAIGIGAHGAFTVARPYVAGGAFLGTAIPWLLSAYFSKKEQLLKGKDNVVNHGVLTAVFQIICSLPYLIACFIKNERVVRILFWIPATSQIVVSLFIMKIFRYLHRDRPNRTTFAVNIELMVEKYEVLSLIVLGEALLAILFDAAVYIMNEKANVGQMYAAVLGATALVASFETLYMNVDNKILREGKHAIRHNAFSGFFWSAIHLPYHVCLVLFGTALGLLFRDIIVTPSDTKSKYEAAEAAVHALVRAAAPKESSGPQFGTIQRWLFSIGWAGSLLFSGILSLTHGLGPRDFTRRARVLIRSCVALSLGVGMPFTDLTAGQYLAVHAVITMFIASIEFMLVNMDSVNLLRKHRSNKKDSSNIHEDDFRDSIDDEEDTDEEYEGEHSESNPLSPNAQPEEPAAADPESQAARNNECRAVRRRLTRMKSRGRNRLVQVNMNDNKNNCADTI